MTIIKIGPDDLCECTCGDSCPLGRSGMSPRCNALELLNAGTAIARSQPLTARYGLELNHLRTEVERLRRGDFTEEEFQNLCHKFGEGDYERFCDGCDEYQRKLFGKDRSCDLLKRHDEEMLSRRKEFLARIQVLHDRIKYLEHNLPEGTIRCEDCGAVYANMGCDVTLPDSHWEKIHPEGPVGILCGSCIARRAHEHGGVAVRAWVDGPNFPMIGPYQELTEQRNRLVRELEELRLFADNLQKINDVAAETIKGLEKKLDASRSEVFDLEEERFQRRQRDFPDWEGMGS